jgi:hypothetical protein
MKEIIELKNGVKPNDFEDDVIVVKPVAKLHKTYDMSVNLTNPSSPPDERKH